MDYEASKQALRGGMPLVSTREEWPALREQLVRKTEDWATVGDVWTLKKNLFLVDKAKAEIARLDTLFGGTA